MPPPPRPPIICYDLQTSNNLRRVPCNKHRIPPLSVNPIHRRPKVTVVRRESNQLNDARAAACWHHHDTSWASEAGTSSDLDATVREPRHGLRYSTSTSTSSTINQHPSRPVTRSCTASNSTGLPKSTHLSMGERPSSSTSNGIAPAHKFNSVNHTSASLMPPMKLPTNLNETRFAYDRHLRQEQAESERLKEFKRRQAVTAAQLEDITSQLNSAKRLYDELIETLGMSHTAAKYIQRQYEENERLRRKVDEFSETRSRELARNIQQRKLSARLQLGQATGCGQPQSEMSPPVKRTVNGSLSSQSPTTNTASQSSSTLSITSSPFSSSSSQKSNDNELVRSVHFVESPRTNRSTPTTRARDPPFSTPQHKVVPPALPDFSFYKPNPAELNETLEITDVVFFDKMEDKTMLEVNDLLNRMHRVLDAKPVT